MLAEHCNPAGGLGGVGDFCSHDSERGSGHCCEKDECDGGMCTYDCKMDKDGPSDMLCEHGECFWACQAVIWAPISPRPGHPRRRRFHWPRSSAGA